MVNPNGWQILLDENIPFRLKYDLRTVGFPTVHVTDVGLGGLPDDVVYAYAARHRHIVITSDRGFHPPYPQLPSIHSGIVLSRLGNSKTLRQEITAAIIALATQYATLENRIIAVEPGGKLVSLP